MSSDANNRDMKAEARYQWLVDALKKTYPEVLIHSWEGSVTISCRHGIWHAGATVEFGSPRPWGFNDLIERGELTREAVIAIFVSRQPSMAERLLYSAYAQ